MKDAVNSLTNKFKSYFSKINKEKIRTKSKKIEENLAICLLFNTDQEMSDNEEKMRTLRIKAQKELNKFAANLLKDLEPSIFRSLI